MLLGEAGEGMEEAGLRKGRKLATREISGDFAASDRFDKVPKNTHYISGLFPFESKTGLSHSHPSQYLAYGFSQECKCLLGISIFLYKE